ncbi:hypothetical protein NXG04_07825 [Klebsiella pneumoniae]|nr:hypothetical protein [Klebsiella pneumoniae]MDS7714463.1 hypothetical protein [Klebsiella pneumoniae]
MEDKTVIEYNVPIQGKKQCDKYNAMCQEMWGADFTPIIPTQQHIGILLQKIEDAIWKVGKDGGMYLGDGIKVKIEIEYDPEDK